MMFSSVRAQYEIAGRYAGAVFFKARENFSAGLGAGEVLLVASSADYGAGGGEKCKA
jgi:hypothetical protein